jgi:hypothetical protein
MNKTIFTYTDNEHEFVLKFKEEQLMYFFTDKVEDKTEVASFWFPKLFEVLQWKTRKFNQIIKNDNDKPLLPSKEFGTSASGMVIFSWKNDDMTKGFEIIYNIQNGITLSKGGHVLHKVKPITKTETETNDGFISFRKWATNEGSYTIKVPIKDFFEKINFFKDTKGCTKENLTTEHEDNVLDITFEPMNRTARRDFLDCQYFLTQRRYFPYLTLICGGKKPMLFKLDFSCLVALFAHNGQCEIKLCKAKLNEQIE